MLIPVQCPRCDHPFRVDSRHAGQVGRCPNKSCAAPVRIPDSLTARSRSQEATATATAGSERRPAKRPVRISSTKPKPKAKPATAKRERVSSSKQTERKREQRKPKRRTQPATKLPARRGTQSRQKRRKQKRSPWLAAIKIGLGATTLLLLAGIGYVLIGGGTTTSGVSATNTVQAAEAPKVDHETSRGRLSRSAPVACKDPEPISTVKATNAKTTTSNAATQTSAAPFRA